MKRHDGEPEWPGLKILTPEDLRNMNIANPIYGPPPCFKNEKPDASASDDEEKTEKFDPEENIPVVRRRS